MAWTFQSKPVATIKAKSATSTDIISVGGCNASETSGDNAATQINKLLDVGGQAVVADANMKLVSTKGVVENG